MSNKVQGGIPQAGPLVIGGQTYSATNVWDRIVIRRAIEKNDGLLRGHQMTPAECSACVQWLESFDFYQRMRAQDALASGK